MWGVWGVWMALHKQDLRKLAFKLPSVGANGIRPPYMYSLCVNPGNIKNLVFFTIDRFQYQGFH